VTPWLMQPPWEGVPGFLAMAVNHLTGTGAPASLMRQRATIPLALLIRRFRFRIRPNPLAETRAMVQVID
jgi:hypothetical protein